MAWNDTFTDGEQWQRVAFVEMFYKAMNERKMALGTATSTEPTAGTNVQSASFWSTVQSWLNSNCTSFVDMTLDLTGTARTASWEWTQANWRSYAGLNANGFRRKRHRRISSTSATVDDQGNARAVGQKAKLTSGTNKGLLHTWNGTTWALVGESNSVNGMFDVLDSASSAPNAVSSYGNMVSGDIIGSWIFNEIRDGMNALLWTRPSFTGAITNWTGTYTAYEATDTAAKSRAESEYIQSGAHREWSRAIHRRTSTPSYQATLCGFDHSYTRNNANTPVDIEAELWVWPLPLFAGGSVDPSEVTYNSGSWGWPANQWSYATSASITGNGSTQNVTITGPVTHGVQPAWPATPPAPVSPDADTYAYDGFRFSDTPSPHYRVILKHDFAYAP